MAWEYELARELRGISAPKGTLEILEGEIVSVSPLTVSLYGGEVMAPPSPLAVTVSAAGYYIENHTLKTYQWQGGERVVCCWMGTTVVILGRLSGGAS